MGHKENFNLKEGEYICPDCGGTGINNQSKVHKSMASSCFTCWGSGKLDWIEMIRGKKAPFKTLSANWTLEVDQDMTALFDVDVEKEIVDVLAEQIAKDVDKQLIKAATKTINPYKIGKK